MTSDPEIDAMSAVHAALEGLPPEVRIRVLQWAWNRYGTDVAATSASDQPGTVGHVNEGGGETGEGEPPTGFDDFVKLYEAADPGTDAERLLVAAYWFQVVEDQGEFTGYEVNKALRNMGHGLSNVTRTIDKAMKEKPAPILQKQKSGRSKQARKSYKLTQAGIQQVREKLRSNYTAA